jgi:hypothetical protein
MARRRRSNSEAGVNLDSLMDALTNVVAVLILVLVLVQMDVTQKVVEFMDNLKPATPEELAESKEKLNVVADLVKKKEALLSEEPPTLEAIEEEKRQLALLEKNAKLNEELLVDLEMLKKLEKELRGKKEEEEVKTTKLQEKIAELEGLLDSTPVLKITPTEVTIPSSRAVPGNADIYYALVFNDRVHLIDPFSPVKLFEEEFRKNKRDWLLQRVTQKGKDRYIYDGRKIVEHFKGFDFENSRGQQLQVVHNPTHTRLHIEVKPDLKEGGTGLEELKESANSFYRAMRSIRSNRQAVIMFWVHPNSFNTYLLARPFADENDVPAGWEVRGNQSYWIAIPDVEVKRLKEPPPPVPDTGPSPPSIKPTLD